MPRERWAVEAKWEYDSPPPAELAPKVFDVLDDEKAAAKLADELRRVGYTVVHWLLG
jgi:hypothetical protein